MRWHGHEFRALNRKADTKATCPWGPHGQQERHMMHPELVPRGTEAGLTVCGRGKSASWQRGSERTTRTERHGDTAEGRGARVQQSGRRALCRHWQQNHASAETSRRVRRVPAAPAPLREAEGEEARPPRKYQGLLGLFHNNWFVTLESHLLFFISELLNSLLSYLIYCEYYQQKSSSLLPVTTSLCSHKNPFHLLFLMTTCTHSRDSYFHVTCSVNIPGSTSGLPSQLESQLC